MSWKIKSAGVEAKSIGVGKDEVELEFTMPNGKRLSIRWDDDDQMFEVCSSGGRLVVRPIYANSIAIETDGY